MRTRGRPKGGWIPDEQRKPALARIRERHRWIAELLACGMTRNEVADLVGMTPERVGQLYNDPAMQELIAQYRSSEGVADAKGLIDLAFARKHVLRNMNRAIIHHSLRLDMAEEMGEPLTIREATQIAEFGADRIGFGKHATNINVNVDFASQLDRALDASRKAKVINGSTPRLVALPEGEGPVPDSVPSPSVSPAGAGGGASADRTVPTAAAALAPLRRKFG